MNNPSLDVVDLKHEPLNPFMMFTPRSTMIITQTSLFTLTLNSYSEFAASNIF